MSKTPFMPLWVSDFLGDTLDLDATEVGAYMLLLMAQWNRSGDSLPNDQKKLQRVARCGRSWPKVWASIQRYFKVDDMGVYSLRLRLEAQNVASKREVKAQNGARGGAAKALKSKEATLANGSVSPKQNPSIPEPEPYIKERDLTVSSIQPDFELEQTAPINVDYTVEAFKIFKAMAERCNLPVPAKLSAARKTKIKARLKDCGGIEGWKTACGKIEASAFCNGATGWQADLDFMLQEKSFTKLMEGSYDDRRSNTSQQPKSSSQDGERIDPTLERIARLAGVSQT